MTYKCIKDVYYGDHLLIKRGTYISDDYPTDAEGKYKPAVDIDFSRVEYFLPYIKNLYNINEIVIFFVENKMGFKCATEYGTIREIYIDDNDEVKYDIAIPSVYNEVISVSEKDIVQKTYRYYYINSDGYISDAIMYMNRHRDVFLENANLMFSNYDQAKKKLNEIIGG